MKFEAFLQAIPPTPGAGEGPAPAVAPQGGAPAQAPPPGGLLGAVFPLLLVVPMVLVMWYTNRNQQKRQKEMEERLKVGDRVLTQSGLIGKLLEKNDRYIKIEIAPGVKAQMLKTSIVGLDAGDEAPKQKEK
ncbi:MAG: preprotein translocase subunit YajC [Polyangiaceae bacterium]|nr:preprotein translocase subunit YajC [Polyangiaceae bacterium]